MIMPPKILKYARNVLFVFGITFLSGALFTIILSKMGVAYFQMIQDAPEKGAQLFYSCVFAPVTEEIWFRLIPITVAMIWISEKRFKAIRWYYAFFLSVIFALFHHNGYWGIYMQGVGGILFMLFIFQKW